MHNFGTLLRQYWLRYRYKPFTTVQNINTAEDRFGVAKASTWESTRTYVPVFHVLFVL